MLYVTVAALTLALLVAHSLKWDKIEVDTTSLGLLAMLVLMPLAPRIRKLSAGGVEAEIGPREAKELQEAAADLPAAGPASSAYPPTAPTILELVDRDPPLGLARLRMDLEQEVKRLYEQVFGETEDRRPRGVGQMARRLVAAGVLPPEVAGPLMDILPIANRAVHGEYVRAEVAEDIARVGIRVIEALHTVSLDEPRYRP